MCLNMHNVSVINYPDFGEFKRAANDMVLNTCKRTAAYFWLPLSKDRLGFEGGFACPTQGCSQIPDPRLGSWLLRTGAGGQAGDCTSYSPF